MTGTPATEHMEPCRFCGHDGDGLQYALEPMVAGASRAQVACLVCGTYGPLADTLEEARRLWNLSITDHQALIAARRVRRVRLAG